MATFPVPQSPRARVGPLFFLRSPNFGKATNISKGAKP
jgi:hypothetical protein